MRWTLIPVVLMMLVLCSNVSMGGQLNPPTGPDNPGSAMYTLEDIYQRLVLGTAGAPRSGGFQGPSSAPVSTMHNLNDIMGQAPTADNTNGAAPSEVLKGRTFWGLLTGGTWGPQTGTAEGETGGCTGDAAASDVLTGKTFSNGIGSGLDGTMSNVGQQNITPGTAAVTITQGYHDGSGQVAGDPDLATGNIADNVEIFGVTGTAKLATGVATDNQVLTGKTYSNAGGSSTGTMPNVGAQNVTPGTAAVTITQGYHDGSGQVAGDGDLIADNIKYGVNIFGVAGTNGGYGIGDIGPAGGIVVFVEGGAPLGLHGLEAAHADQIEGAVWGCYGTMLEANGLTVGTGASNSINIATNCTDAGIAAKIAESYNTTTKYSFGGWYLPSMEEMMWLYRSRFVLGGLWQGLYWTSSQYPEFPSIMAYAINFADGGNAIGLNKGYLAHVRAVRTF